MRILLYDRIYEPHGVSYPLKDAFESLGHQTDMFDWSNYLFPSNGKIINRIKNRILFTQVAKRINRDILDKINNCQYDLLLVLRGDHLFRETIIEAKRRIPLIANLNTDDFFNPLNSTKYMYECFTLYDYIFSPREHLREEYLKKGAKSFEIFNWYYSPSLPNPPVATIPEEYRYEITFVGSWSKRRENIISALEGLDVNVFGWGWNKKAQKTFLSKIKCQPSISMREMIGVFSSSKININIFTAENRDRTNPRNFDIPAVAGFQLSERSDEILEFFEEDHEIVCYENNDQLRAKCDFYLKNEQQRQEIAINGYNKLINSNYSIVDTAKQILNIVAS